MDGRLESAVRGRFAVWAAVLLLAIRFTAPSVTASLGVQGVDTSGLTAVVGAYDAVLPVLLAALVVAVVLATPRLLDRSLWAAIALVGLAGSLIAWSGEVDARYRLVWGAWATMPLTISVTVTLASYGLALDRTLGRATIPSASRDAFRTLHVTFVIAYLLGALRFVDYAYTLQVTLPSGVRWLLNYAPTLLPAFVAIYFWIRWSWRPEATARGIVRFIGLPLVGGALGVGVAEGFGGFILSNVLAWGGAYEVFVPTTSSLALVGFAVGAFLSTAWTLRGRLDPTTWRFVVGGVAATALAGILFFDGALGSLAGIALGLTFVARGLRDRESRPRRPSGPSFSADAGI